MRRLAIVLGGAALVAGCGDDAATQRATTTAAPPTTTPTSPPATAPATTSGAATTALRVYFLQDGKLVATSRTVPRTEAVGGASLDALAAGPTNEERAVGITSACDAAVGGSTLGISGGDARVTPAPSGECAAQVGWTLTQFPTVARVNGADRTAYESLAPQILVDTPPPFAAVTSALRVTGTANTFEATFEYDLLDSAGRVLAHHFVTATSGTGTRGTFDVTVDVDVDRAQDGKLVVYERSAEDGSRLHTRAIPLRLEPPR